MIEVHNVDESQSLLLIRGEDISSISDRWMNVRYRDGADISLKNGKEYHVYESVDVIRQLMSKEVER